MSKCKFLIEKTETNEKTGLVSSLTAPPIALTKVQLQSLLAVVKGEGMSRMGTTERKIAAMLPILLPEWERLDTLARSFDSVKAYITSAVSLAMCSGFSNENRYDMKAFENQLNLLVSTASGSDALAEQLSSMSV
jgi:hypothetical protein